MKRQFSHDCDACVYLGSDEKNDFYFCKKAIPTVIARFGNNGEDYTSGLTAATLCWERGLDVPLVSALRLAKEKGLIK